MLNDFVSNLIDALKAAGDKPKAYDTEATVLRIDGHTAWCHIEGGSDETPIKLTVQAKAGDRVQIRVGNGTAWITGNITSPPTDDSVATTARKEITEEANTAREAEESAAKTATDYISGTASGTDIKANGETVVSYGYEKSTSKRYVTYGSRDEDTSNGNYSVAEGTLLEASGICSHAEGQSSQAKGAASHAEGNSTIAGGNYSHAEGVLTKAQGIASHAEGFGQGANITQALGNYSHAEGSSTTANGQSSHAEGGATQANGNFSHAEGQGTVANGIGKHVEGRYNHPDINNRFASIVGGGKVMSNTTYPKNLMAIEWHDPNDNTKNGDLRIKGDVYVGCNDDSSGGTKLVAGGGGGASDYIADIIDQLTIVGASFHPKNDNDNRVDIKEDGVHIYQDGSEIAKAYEEDGVTYIAIDDEESACIAVMSKISGGEYDGAASGFVSSVGYGLSYASMVAYSGDHTAYINIMAQSGQSDYELIDIKSDLTYISGELRIFGHGSSIGDKVDGIIDDAITSIQSGTSKCVAAINLTEGVWMAYCSVSFEGNNSADDANRIRAIGILDDNEQGSLTHLNCDASVCVGKTSTTNRTVVSNAKPVVVTRGNQYYYLHALQRSGTTIKIHNVVFTAVRIA